MQIKQWDLVIKPGLKYETYPRVKSQSPVPGPGVTMLQPAPFSSQTFGANKKIATLHLSCYLWAPASPGHIRALCPLYCCICASSVLVTIKTIRVTLPCTKLTGANKIIKRIDKILTKIYLITMQSGLPPPIIPTLDICSNVRLTIASSAWSEAVGFPLFATFLAPTWPQGMFVCLCAC